INLPYFNVSAFYDLSPAFCCSTQSRPRYLTYCQKCCIHHTPECPENYCRDLCRYRGLGSTDTCGFYCVNWPVSMDPASLNAFGWHVPGEDGMGHVKGWCA